MENNRPENQKKKRKLSLGKLILFILAAVLAAGLIVGAIPTRRAGLISQPSPLSGYAAAVAEFNAIKAAESGVVNADSGSLLMTHGQKTPRAIIFVHGTTNSPRQFEELGQLLFQRGYNVLILRMPYHGLNSHSVSELDVLKAEDLVRYADQALDIGSMLGDKITVIGISGGGVVAAWIAQNRPEVDTALLMVPFFGVAHISRFVDGMFINLFGRLPNINVESQSEPRRGWVYRGESTHGVVAFLTVSAGVYKQAQTDPPGAKKIIVVTTASDTNVNNTLTYEMIALWKKTGTPVETFEFERSMDIPHNSIDPAADPVKRNIVYAKILEMLGENPLE
jgi:carboxylesterase